MPWTTLRHQHLPLHRFTFNFIDITMSYLIFSLEDHYQCILASKSSTNLATQVEIDCQVKKNPRGNYRYSRILNIPWQSRLQSVENMYSRSLHDTTKSAVPFKHSVQIAMHHQICTSSSLKRSSFHFLKISATDSPPA
jgi:hypothetical protein